MRRTAGFLLLAFTTLLQAGDSRDDWAAITALDAGPGVKPKTAAEAYGAAIEHTAKQEKALRKFLESHPGDGHALEATLRLARLLDLRAEMKSEPPSAESASLLDKAEGIAVTPEQRTELEFALLAREMRNWRSKRPPIEDRRTLLKQARKFEAAHPSDRRIPMLLVEMATLFDFEPTTKERLLLDAKKLTKDSGLTAQIADDLRRLSFIGRPLPLRFVALDGRRVDVRAWEGSVVAIVFFATGSANSKAALLEVKRAVEAAGSGVQIAAVSLDSDRADVEDFLRAEKITFPVAWDGKGWDGPLMQALGINSVPTTWLLDTKGALRSLDALHETDAQLRKLLGK